MSASMHHEARPEGAPAPVPAPAAAPAAAGGAGEIVSLTSLRGILALWVVVYHFWDDVVRLFPRMDALSPLARVGHMAVPAFFLLSGFVLAYNYADRFQTLRRREVTRFLLLRLARVYPVHFVTLLAVLAMVIVSRRLSIQVTDAGYTPRDFVLNLLLMQTWTPDFQLNWNYPSWSISSEWFAYLIFPFAVSVGLRHLTTPLRATAAGLLWIVAAVGVMLWWQPLPFFELVLVVPTFFAGASAYWMLRGRIGAGGPASAAWRWLPEVLVALAVASTFVPSPQVVAACLVLIAFALLLVLARLGGHCSGLWLAWPVVYAGEVSYSLYMTHTLAQKVVYVVLPSARYAGAAAPTKLGVLAAYALLVAAACLASYYAVEQPCRAYFKKRARRPAGPTATPAPQPTAVGG